MRAAGLNERTVAGRADIFGLRAGNGTGAERVIAAAPGIEAENQFRGRSGEADSATALGEGAAAGKTHDEIPIAGDGAAAEGVKAIVAGADVNKTRCVDACGDDVILAASLDESAGTVVAYGFTPAVGTGSSRQDSGTAKNVFAKIIRAVAEYKAPAEGDRICAIGLDHVAEAEQGVGSGITKVFVAGI